MRENPHRIGVFGLGYKGSVTVACFALLGHKIISVGMDLAKTEMPESGRSPIVEVENLKKEFEPSAWHVDGTRSQIRTSQGTVRNYE
jgi:UDP-glucose 6-dehydrogenase